MKKVLVALVSLALISMAMAAMPAGPSAYNGLHKSAVTHLYLYEKTGTPDWNIVEDGAWGKMTIKKDESVVFNGHHLIPEMDYTLVNYGGWPVVACMGTGTSDEYGDVHIMGALPDEILIEGENNGAKFWLVLSSDVDCDAGQFTAWNWSEYLFEYDLVQFE